VNSNINNKILILDFGSQYSQLIARCVRELGVYCEIISCTASEEKIKSFQPTGIILSGGPETVTEKNTPRAPECVFQLGCPILGICYGMQTMAVQLGGKVIADAHSEFGHADLDVVENNSLLSQTVYHVWMSHGDQVAKLPDDFICIGKTHNTPIAAMANVEKNFYGVQFHPEVTHTKAGKDILSSFLYGICECKPNWTSENIVEKILTDLQQVHQNTDKNTKVLLGLSGGVDSLVAAVLLQKVFHKNLVCIYVDHGLQRLQESDYLLNQLGNRLNLLIISVDAKQKFLSSLKNISDPELKRKKIGELFIDVFVEEARKISRVGFLAQGTIYSDVIESSDQNGNSKVIKSHHNVGGLPEKLALPLIEPLRECFKDEVRKIGLHLGLTYEEVYRHPFPGPGLAVRILGEVTETAIETLRNADHIFMQELYKENLYHRVSQAFCVFLPVNSVGVTGDARLYAPVIALRCIESIDFMTATAAELPHAFLQQVARRITNEVKNVSRVVYDVTSKPPATIEWE
jgi:GMP synthase (glutamine-hydrolysing)